MKKTSERSESPTPTEIREELERILGSKPFNRSKQLAAFLGYVVSQTLEGRGERLNASQIAIDALGRDETFDASTDPLVRVQARNLRKVLEHYYGTDGSQSDIYIDVPKGGYVPRFQYRVATAFGADDADMPAVGGRPAIAVLPFELSGGKDDQIYFAEGITQELINAFTQYAELDVIVRHSVDAYQGPQVDVRRVGKELGVRFILQGSVRTASGMVRVSAWLVDTHTREHLWAETFDRALTAENLFAVQDEITRDVVARIAGVQGVILHTLEKETHAPRTTELSVYEAVLQFHHYNIRLSKDTYNETRAALELAVEKDPEYALAWALLAEMFTDGFTLSLATDEDALEKAAAYAKRAIALDPNCQHARWELAQARFHMRDSEGSMQELEEVLNINPNAAFFVGAAGWQIALLGDWDRGLEIMHQAIRLNPRHPGWFHLAPFLNHYRQGHFEAALAEARKFNMPQLPWDQVLRTAAFQRLGLSRSASRTMRELLEVDPQFPNKAEIYVGAYVFDEDLATDIVSALREAGLPAAPGADQELET